jgi:hypothetical protein
LDPGIAGSGVLWYNDGMNPILSKETEILSRVIGPENPAFTPEAARSILQLRFTDADVEQMNRLASKAREGTLSEDEQSQLHGYLFVGAMVDLMHSKARLSLKKSVTDPHG